MTRPPRIKPRGLSRIDAAGYIGVSTTRFDQLVADGRMPQPIRLGRRVLWDRREVDAVFDALAESESEMEFVA